MEKAVIGADTGSSHITYRIFDIESKQSVNRQEALFADDDPSSKDNILNTRAGARKKAIENRNVKYFFGIGFAMPGPFNYENGNAWFDIHKRICINCLCEFHRLLAEFCFNDIGA